MARILFIMAHFNELGRLERGETYAFFGKSVHEVGTTHPNAGSSNEQLRRKREKACGQEKRLNWRNSGCPAENVSAKTANTIKMPIHAIHAWTKYKGQSTRMITSISVSWMEIKLEGGNPIPTIYADIYIMYYST